MTVLEEVVVNQCMGTVNSSCLGFTVIFAIPVYIFFWLIPTLQAP